MHYQQSVQSVDFAAQKATFAGPGGSSEVSYDLLVGADGRHSGVRRQLQQHDPAVHSYFERRSPLDFVTFAGIQPTGAPQASVRPPASACSCSVGAAQRSLTVFKPVHQRWQASCCCCHASLLLSGLPQVLPNPGRCR